jgi:hypothetical protein
MESAALSRARTPQCLPQCLVVAFALLIIQACSNDNAGVLPMGPGCPRTGIAGAVTLARRPAKADLSVRRAVSNDWEYVWTRTATDASGRFFLPLPPGRYVLFASAGDVSVYAGWSARGPVVRSEPPDTLVVEEGRETIADFRFGLARLAITLPESMNDTYCSLQFYRWPVMPGQGSAGQVSVSRGTSLRQATAGLPIGVWAVSFTADGVIGETWMPETPSPGAADSIVVPDGEGVLHTWAPCPGVATLRGSVHGSWERLGADSYSYRPYVSVFTEDSLRLAGTHVEDDGVFRFQFLQAHRVRLTVRVGDIERWMGGGTFTDAETFVVVPNEEAVVPPFTESGLIVRLVPPTPWSTLNPRIIILDAGGHTYSWTGILRDADVVLVPNLAGGAYRLRVEPLAWSSHDWLPQWYDGADSASAATPVTVPSDGGVTTITVRLQPGSRAGPS